MAAKELKYTAESAEPLVIKLKYALCTVNAACRSTVSPLRCAALHCTAGYPIVAIESAGTLRVGAKRRHCAALLCSPLQGRLH